MNNINSFKDYCTHKFFRYLIQRNTDLFEKENKHIVVRETSLP